MGRPPGLRITWAALVLLLVVPLPAGASELAGGVSVGAFKAGAVPTLAITPHAGIGWRRECGFLLVINDLFSFLAPINKAGIGVYNKISVTIGYAWKDVNLSAGPSLSIYSMPACGVTLLCGRVVGVAPGGHAQADVYLAGPMGVSVSANLDWIGGSSAVLPGGVAAMVVAGPVIRWSAE